MRRTAKQIGASAAVITLILGVNADAVAKKVSSKACKTVAASAVFQQNCASCHAGGGNTVNPNKPVAGSSKLASLPMFKSYLENPVGHMPFYKHVVSDKKTLKALYDYCKSLKRGKGA